MRRRGKLLVGVFSTAMLVVFGCTERVAPTLPEASTAPSFSRDGEGGPQQAKAAERRYAVGAQLSATESIGEEGGTIELKSAGLRVEIPAGALPVSGSEHIDITVTAVPGSSLAYEFEPHGLVFRTPITIEQDLRGTDLDGNPALAAGARGAYFEGDLSNGIANVLEVRPTAVDVRGGSLTFSAAHFSGYLVAVGYR